MKALHLFCGGGGFALGTQRAGFETVGAFDFDPRAVLGTMSPAALRDACTGRPDVVFTSPPCTIPRVHGVSTSEVATLAGARRKRSAS